MKVLQTDTHDARKVDPFGLLPCRHTRVDVHITDSDSIGDDLVECTQCGYVITLAELYKGMTPPGGATPPESSP